MLTVDLQNSAYQYMKIKSNKIKNQSDYNDIYFREMGRWQLKEKNFRREDGGWEVTGLNTTWVRNEG